MTLLLLLLLSLLLSLWLWLWLWLSLSAVVAGVGAVEAWCRSAVGAVETLVTAAVSGAVQPVSSRTAAPSTTMAHRSERITITPTSILWSSLRSQVTADAHPPVTPGPAGGQDREVSTRVVGIGGSVDAGSQSDLALRCVLARAVELGGDAQVYSGLELDLPPYHHGAVLPDPARDYVDAVRRADAVVISSPGYHGTVSGLVKNALDYLEELRGDQRPYLDGRPVGLVAVASGWQAAVGTLGTLRQIVHSLRGWPTPLGLSINSSVTHFDENGHTTDDSTSATIAMMARQLIDFGRPDGTTGSSG